VEFEIIYIFILGAILGSFGNVLIVRIPKEQSIVKPPSHCPKCKTSLKFYHNIPLLSWLFLRGKCATCNQTIPYRYPLIELLSALLFVIIYLHMGATIFALFTALTFFLLLILSTIDIEYKAVPDHINLPAVITALFTSSLFLNNLESALLMAGTLSMLRFFTSWFVGQEALGEGDIIVGATMGALLGITGSLAALFIASLIALPFGLYDRFNHQEPQIPFIPFLALGTFIIFLFGDVSTLFSYYAR
jgi:leader peptidase (prepilin peptidase) / N-methyltransferase